MTKDTSDQIAELERAVRENGELYARAKAATYEADAQLSACKRAEANAQADFKRAVHALAMFKAEEIAKEVIP